LLDGQDDYLVSEPLDATFIASDFTLSVWLHWLSAPGKPGLLAFWGNLRTLDFSIDLSYRDPFPFLHTTSGTVFVASSRTIGDDRWHVLTIVRDRDAALMYLDEALVGSGTGELRLGGTSSTFYLGRQEITHLFGGVLDEVAIYNRALSPSEVAANAIPEPCQAALLAIVSGLAATKRRSQRCVPLFVSRHG